MIIEFRRYTVAPAQADALSSRFENHAVRAMREHGYLVLGFWVTEVSALGTLNYLLAWDSLDARREKH